MFNAVMLAVRLTDSHRFYIQLAMTFVFATFAVESLYANESHAADLAVSAVNMEKNRSFVPIQNPSNFGKRFEETFLTNPSHRVYAETSNGIPHGDVLILSHERVLGRGSYRNAQPEVWEILGENGETDLEMGFKNGALDSLRNSKGLNLSRVSDEAEPPTKQLESRDFYNEASELRAFRNRLREEPQSFPGLKSVMEKMKEKPTGLVSALLQKLELGATQLPPELRGQEPISSSKMNEILNANASLTDDPVEFANSLSSSVTHSMTEDQKFNPGSLAATNASKNLRDIADPNRKRKSDFFATRGQ